MALWIFGYASLMWNPGFAPAERVVATASGYERSFCMWSIHHRGSEAAPGLVLALDESAGGSCRGLALRVAEGEEEPVLAMLRERELVSSAYHERRIPLALADGRDALAVAYIVDRAHRQYVRLPLAEQAAIIARAHGGRGPNDAYLFDTAAHLREIGHEDPELERLAAMVRGLKAGGGAGAVPEAGSGGGLPAGR